MEKTEEIIRITIDDLVDDLETESIEDDVEEKSRTLRRKKEPEAQIEDSEIVMAFENLALVLLQRHDAAEAFGEMVLAMTI